MKCSIDLQPQDIKELKKVIADYNRKSGEKQNLSSFMKMLILKELPGNEAADVSYQINKRKAILPNGETIEYS